MRAYGPGRAGVSGEFQDIQDFPDSKAVQERIEAKLKSTGLNDPALKEAYDTLHAMD
jgi:hypothetical protein